MFRTRTLLALSLLIPLTAHANESNLYPSTYEAAASPTTAIVNATILTGTGERFENATVLFEDGRIVAVGEDIDVPADAVEVDASGKWVTPGVIDAHSHIGVFPAPGVPSNRDGNEKTGNNTAHVWIEHAVWPQDAAFDMVRQGGVTTLLVLPGSANLIGGRGVVLKNVPATTAQSMKFPDAPHGLKMACGENPVNTYGSRNGTPFTRMGNIAGFRNAWFDAHEYKDKWDRYQEKVDNGDEDATPPTRDLKLDTLMGVLRGEIGVHIHCYRAEEMAQMIDLSKEFDFQITAFHHAVEAYKIADLLAEEGIAVATWANRWGFKLEAYDGAEANIALLLKAGVDVIVHSDSARIAQRLNTHTAIGMARARDLGVDVSRAEAIKWITANPARAMGILDDTGTLEVGKAADIALWSRDPFSVYALAEQVYVDGVRLFDRDDPSTARHSDILIGQGVKQ